MKPKRFCRDTDSFSLVCRCKFFCVKHRAKQSLDKIGVFLKKRIHRHHIRAHIDEAGLLKRYSALAHESTGYSHERKSPGKRVYFALLK